MNPLKSLIRISIAFLLLLCLTISAFAAEAPNFSAIAQKGNQESVPGVIVLTKPKFYVSEIRTFSGKYTVYRSASTGELGITDCYGNIYFRTAYPEIGMLEPYDCGLVAVATDHGWQPYNIYGRRLCDEQYGCSEIGVVPDWATGQWRYMIGELRYKDEPGRIDSLLVDVYGHQMVEDQLGLIYGGMTTYLKNGKWGLCRLFGETILPCTYDYLWFVAEDVLLAERSGVYSLIDSTGRQLLSLNQYDDVVSAAPFYPRLLVEKNGKWGVLDLLGNQILPCIYTQLEGPYDYYYGKTGGLWHYLEEDGMDITLSDDRYGGNYAEKITQDIYFKGKDRKITLIDRSGNQLIPDWYTDQRSSGGFILLATLVQDRPEIFDGCVYNEDVQKLLEFSGASDFGATKDRIVIYKNNAVEFYDADGVLRQTLDQIDTIWIDDWYCIVSRGGQYAMASSEGKLLTGFDYSDRHTSADGLLSMRRGGKWYLLNAKGELILTPSTDECIYFDQSIGAEEMYSAYKTEGAIGFLKYREAGASAFIDVDENAWYAKNVDFCEKAGLMNGVGGGKFAPGNTMTRAMLVQVLYNLSGEACPPYGFTDVPETAWYYDAINWAAANGIVNGVGDGKFSPNDPVTREQTVTILRRYALNFSDADFSGDALAAFSDAALVSNYARDSMCWAVQIGLINGRTPTNLAPGGHTTRAEIAAILQRFVLLYAS